MHINSEVLMILIDYIYSDSKDKQDRLVIQIDEIEARRLFYCLQQAEMYIVSNKHNSMESYAILSEFINKLQKEFVNNDKL